MSQYYLRQSNEEIPYHTIPYHIIPSIYSSENTIHITIFCTLKIQSQVAVALAEAMTMLPPTGALFEIDAVGAFEYDAFTTVFKVDIQCLEDGSSSHALL